MAETIDREVVTDEQVISLIQSGIMNSVGDWLNSADIARERQKSTYEYGMMADGHLAPQGVSQIVSSDTVEVVEGYLAILSELLMNNNKLAKFVPYRRTPTSLAAAKTAADMLDYVVFKQNQGWNIISTWMKSALLWKNSIVRWGYVEDFEYKFEEFEEITQENLDILLADEDTEVVGELSYEPQLANLPGGEQTIINVYRDVRIRHKIDRSRIKISNVHPELFRISRDAHTIEDAPFVAVQSEMTRSEMRKYYPETTKDINWDEVGDGATNFLQKYSEERAVRKRLVGEEYYLVGRSREVDLDEASRTVNVTESWMRVDRDNDGIAEMKHFITAGKHILLEEDCDCIPLAVLCPFEVPHEFHGLSAADMIRPTTLATTAVLRGFVENVYLTNYSPKLADPNIVDFSALQNMKPKQLIATNGNPNNAVAALTPDTISQGTVPLLETMQLHKEQSTGLSKAAQGLNDTLYVSGNSEEKMQRAMSAAQVRIQYMARRFAETGFKQLATGVYKMLREKMAGKKIKFTDSKGLGQEIDPASLPEDMELWVSADVGENGNSTMARKMGQVAREIIPALKEAGAGGVVNPEAAANIAAKALEALDLDPLEFIVDYTTPEFKEQAKKARDAETQAAEKLRQLEEQVKKLDIMQREATIALTNIQSKNAIQDNMRQMIVAMDRHQQEWAELRVKAAKDGIDIELVKQPSMEDMVRAAWGMINQDASAPINSPKVEMPAEGDPAAAIMSQDGQMH
jgi:hypothetical protein